MRVISQFWGSCLVILTSSPAIAEATSGPMANPAGGGYRHGHPQYQQQQWPGDQNQQREQYGLDPVSVSQQQERDGAENTLPSGWSEHFDPASGMPYYYNANDGTTTWDRPEQPKVQEEVIPRPVEQEAEEEISGGTENVGEPEPATEEPKKDETSLGDKFSSYPEYSQQDPAEAQSPPPDPADKESRFDFRDPETGSGGDQPWGVSQRGAPQQMGGWVRPEQRATAPGKIVESHYQQQQQQQEQNGLNLVARRAEEAPVDTGSQGANPSGGLPPGTSLDGLRPSAPVQPREQESFPDQPQFDRNLEHRQPQLPLQEYGEQAPPPQQQPEQQQADYRQTVPQRYGKSQPLPQQGSQTQRAPWQTQQPGQYNPYGHATYGQQGYGQPPHQGYAQQQGYNPYGRYGGPPGAYGQQRPPRYGNQLVAQQVESGSPVKEALGSAWQGILGWSNRTKEVVGQARDTVVTSATAAGQTVASTSAGIWGQAKNSIGSVFEGDDKTKPPPYSLSGQYGAPPAPGQPPQGYPPQQYGGYPPRYDLPQHHEIPPYPHQAGQPQQQMRQPPPQTQWGGGPPQGYPHRQGLPQQRAPGPHSGPYPPQQQQPGTQPHQQQPQQQGDQRRNVSQQAPRRFGEDDPPQQSGWGGGY